jgi:WD40 repeat protein
MNIHVAALLVICFLPLPVLAQSGRQLKTFSVPGGVTVQYGMISRAGNMVATIDSDNVLRVWSMNSGELLRSLADGNHPPTGAAFSSDWQLLAVAFQIVANEKGVLRVFDVDSWKTEREFGVPDVFTLAFSPDNRRLALSGLVTQIWDVENSKILADISPRFGGSSALSFSTDGRWIVTADGDACARVYDAGNGKLRSSTDFLLEPMAAIVGDNDKTISIIDPERGNILRRLPKQPGLILSLDVSPDGKQIAVIYGDADHFLTVNHLMLWDTGRGTILADFQKRGITILGGAFLGDHYQFALVNDNQLEVWSLP